MLLVNGGPTDAGRKLPVQERHDLWMCVCGRVNQGFIVRCLEPGCNEPRP